MTTNMADKTARPSGGSTSSSGHKSSLLLHVVSPSTEVPDRLTFNDIAISTTIAELKQKIQDAAPSKPALERQRLIFRGRPLLQSEMTLLDVFGANIIESSDALTLHLVVSPIANALPAASTHRPSPNSGLPSQAPRPMGLPELPRIPVQTSQAPAPNQGAHTQGGTVPPGFPNAPNVPGTAAVPMQNPMLAHMQAVQMHHLAAMEQINRQFQQTRMNFQQQVAQQQQARAAAGQYGIGVHNIAGNQDGSRRSSMQDGRSFSGQSHHSPRSGSPAGFHHHHVNVVINGQPMGRSPSPLQGLAPNDGIPMQTTANSDLGLQRLRERVSHMEIQLDNNHPPLDRHVAELAAGLSQALRGARPSDGPEWRVLNDRMINIQRRTNVLMSNVVLPPHLSSAAEASSNSPLIYLLSSPEGPQAILMSPTTMFTSPNLTASFNNPFVANQPGLSPFPFFGHHSPIPSRPSSRTQSRTRQPTYQAPPVPPENNQLADAVLNIPPPPPGQVDHPLQPPGGAPVPQQAHQEQGQQARVQGQAQPDQARDLLNLLIPVGGHLWLLIRLFGIVYLFTNGAGWGRFMLMCGAALIVFIAQSGALRPARDALWEPIRRHIEGLIRLEPDGRRAPVEETQGDAATGGDANGRAGATAATGVNIRNEGPGIVQRRRGDIGVTPEQVANRLLQERHGGGRGGGAAGDTPVWRRQILRLERAIALFIASLVPDVGERYVAMRNEVEEQRRQTREQQMRQLEEAADALAAAAATAAAAAATTTATTANGDDDGNAHEVPSEGQSSTSPEAERGGLPAQAVEA